MNKVLNIKEHPIKLSVCLSMIIAFILLSSCSSVDVSEMQSGLVSLKVTISKQTQTTATRTISDAIYNVIILVFNSRGYLIGNTYNSTNPTSVTLPVRVSNDCTICAIANTGSSSYLDGISTLSELRAKVTEPVADPASILGIMYGETSGVNINTSTVAQSVSLKRIYSKYTFTITPAKDITITDYQLCNVPNECFIAPINSNNPTTGYSGLNYNSVTTAVSAGSVVTAGPYYVYENISGKNTSSTSEEQRTSAYAPSGASYILINAKRDTGWGTGWSSTYRVYLGGVTNETNPVVDYADFNIYRNYDYNCNISISGSGTNDLRVTYTPYSTRMDIYTGDAPIGNYLYSDGTNGTTFRSGQTLGIIYSRELTRSQYDAGCRHGKVLARELAYSDHCQWSDGNNSPYTDRTSHPYVTTLKDCFNDISSVYDALVNQSFINTSSNYAWYYCNNYNDGTTKSFTNSGWYLPTAGDWLDVLINLSNLTDSQKKTIKLAQAYTVIGGLNIIDNLDGTYFSALNSKLSAIGGHSIPTDGNGACSFWSASECDLADAVTFTFGPSFVYVCHASKAYSLLFVRAVLAY